MSGGLMSCVRENSPPLEMDINVSGPLSLPEPGINNSDLMGSVHSSSHHNIASSTPLAAQISSHHLDGSSSGGGGGSGCSGGGAACSTPIATPPNTEQTKRRRFHPLRNLRRIFRRRTITSATTAAAETPTATITTATTAASSNSEKNLRSATLSSITSVASASSPSSPLTHQQLQDAYLTQSLPKSKSAYSSLLGGGGGKKHQSHDYNINAESKGKTKHKHKNQKHQQQQQSKELDFERYQQQQLQQQQNAEDMFGTTTQTSANYHHQSVQHYAASTAAAGGAMTSKSSLLSQRQSMGVAVFPGAINRSFFTERQKLRSVGDSSQDLDSGSGNDSGTGGGHNSSAMERVKNNGGSASGGEMSDSQRSLSEGRLVDSDYSRDGLSQSHDSVFSESATASSLSIVLKAELADVLRKRRNRPDASDEDLGLPRSPASPQRRGVANSNSQNYVAATATASSSASKSTMAEKHSGEVSSLSLLSMNSTDGEDLLSNTPATTTTAANNSTTSAATTTTTTEIVQEQRTSAAKYSRSISMSSDILRQRDLSSFNDTKDEVDLFSNDWQRLSHSAAKHKMAIRPTKKKGGPSRQHRRTLETSIPEANEDLNRIVNKQTQEFKDLETRAKTRSLPPGVNAAKLLEETHTATAKESTSKAMKTNTSMTPQTVNTTTTTTTTTTSSSNLFGLRNLTAKASAMFESKDTQSNEETNKKSSESSKKSDSMDKPSQQLVGESSESGFLRRLMHRNSKRSIARVNNGDEDQDELDKKQNEPKKMQMSNSASHIEQTKSHEFVMYESSVEEKRKEIKKEIYNEGKTMGLTTISNSFAISAKEERKLEDKSPAKPKSGPAARQRYLPQNISNEDLIKINEEKSVSKESILSKSSLTNESFQSTSLIREITKQQNQQQLTATTTTTTTSPIKSDHHFEKKPKILGLSAFQQKVSRSNDSFARSSSNNISTISLDKSEEDLMASTTRNMQAAYEQKQRKSVEKSRSFRAYGEQKESLTSPTVHNNMPSLPDLSLNLRVPFYKDFLMHDKEYSSPSPPELLDEKHTSLGFEINDNKLVKPDARDIRKSFTSYDKNIILTTTTTSTSNNAGHTPNKTTPTKLLASATMVSPFASSSSTNSCNKNITEIENNIDMIVKSPFVSVIRKSINLNEEQAEDVIKITTTMPPSTCLTEKVRPTVLPLKKEKSLSEENILNSPSTACVTLRDKPSKKINNLYSNSMENNAKDHVERKSAPAVKTSNGFRSNSTRRSSSVVESTQADKPRSTVPEFMKIQLNRVEPCRTSKSHVVLAKNVKETPLPPARETTPEKHNNSSSSMDDLSFRRLSSESVDINERETSPETEKRFTGLYHEAVNKQAKLCTGLPPKSPNKKLPTTPTTPPTPTINDRDAIVFESTSSNTSPSSNTNSLSLQERKRLFMMEERTKMEKKMEEIRFERKKSICDEVNKKTVTKASESDQRDKDLSPSDNNNCVILRKKSFASSVHSLNGNTVSNNNQSPTNKDDATPELMKVFARRSLKIKDEDLDKILNSNGCCSHNMSSAPQTLKKFNSIPAPAAANPNVDSDKENQSASDEKLDKLPKLDAAQASTLINKSHNTTQLLSATAGNCNNNNNNNNNIGCNRNSLADFRLAGSKANHSALATNNNINNNNNNNCNSNGETTGKSNNSFLPPIKMVGVNVGVAGFRAMSIERNNNHNNCAVLSPAKAASSTLERPTLKLGDLSSSSSTDDPIITISKTIERSATMGEFKGIHQRRAEWEQRAKEALK